MGTSGHQLSRRRLILGASTIGVLGAISACTPETGPGPSPSPTPAPTVTRDPDARRRAAAAEAAGALVGAYDATISTHPTLAQLLVPLRTDHRAHLAAVEPASATTGPPVSPPSSTAEVSPTATEPSGATTSSTTGPVTSPSPGSGTAPPAVPADPAQARAALALAETAAADRARADAVTASDPAFARLLASVTASRVLHATILRAGT